MNTVDFGNMILKLRKKLGLTQLELAQKLNVSDKAVSKWENGMGYPEITQLPVLAEIFGVSVDYLLKGNPKGIVIAGNILADVVNMIDKYPEKNMLSYILSTNQAVGGCVPNTLINLAKIDPDIFLTAKGKIGNDEYGRYVVAQMKKYGIDTNGVSVSKTLSTSVGHVMTEVDTGERTFFHSKGANAEFSIDDIDIDSLECKIFHIGYIMLLDELDSVDPEYGTKMARLLSNISKKGIKTSIDVVSSTIGDYASKIIPVLKYCDYAILNETESCMVTGLNPRNGDGTVNVDNIRKTMEAFIKYGVREKVIVHCVEAGFMMNADGKFTIVPSLKLPDGYIKGSVGAGDSYAAGCLYGLYNGYEDEKILEFASCAAAANLSEADSISGMKPKKELEKMHTMYERQTI